MEGKVGTGNTYKTTINIAQRGGIGEIPDWLRIDVWHSIAIGFEPAACIAFYRGLIPRVKEVVIVVFE
jgi:hypothetical protein